MLLHSRIFQGKWLNPGFLGKKTPIIILSPTCCGHTWQNTGIQDNIPNQWELHPGFPSLQDFPAPNPSLQLGKPQHPKEGNSVEGTSPFPWDLPNIPASGTRDVPFDYFLMRFIPFVILKALLVFPSLPLSFSFIPGFLPICQAQGKKSGRGEEKMGICHQRGAFFGSPEIPQSWADPAAGEREFW